MKHRSAQRKFFAPSFWFIVFAGIVALCAAVFLSALFRYYPLPAGTTLGVSANNPFGLMGGYDILSEDVKNIFGVQYYRLGSIFYQGQNKGNDVCGKGSGCAKATAQGLSLILTIRFNAGATTPSFLPDKVQQPTDWYFDDDPKWNTTEPYYNNDQMQPYKNWIKDVVIPNFQPVGLVIENEEGNTSVFYSAGPSPRANGDEKMRYRQELTAACDAVKEYNLAHNTSIFCSNGGAQSDTVSKLTWYHLTKTKGAKEACAFITDVFSTAQAQTAKLFCKVPDPLPPQSACYGSASKYYGKSWSAYSNDALGWLRGCQGATTQPDDIERSLAFMDIYKKSSNSYMNFHWYNSKIGYPKLPDQSVYTERIRQVKEYLEFATGKTIFTNEIGQRDGEGGDANAMYVTPLLTAMHENQFPYVIWYTILGSAADAFMSYPPLILNASGQAFVNYMRQFAPTQTVTPTLSPTDMPVPTLTEGTSTSAGTIIEDLIMPTTGYSSESSVLE